MLWKGLTLLWVPASIVLTAIAIANIINGFNPDAIAWAEPFGKVLNMYTTATGNLFAPAGKMMHEYVGLGVPPWASDGLVAYAATASGFAFGGSNFTSRDGEMHTLRSSAASIGWPLAILGFGASAVKNRVVTKFAAQHTALFVLYFLAVAAVLAFGVWGNALLKGAG